MVHVEIQLFHVIEQRPIGEESELRIYKLPNANSSTTFRVFDAHDELWFPPFHTFRVARTDSILHGEFLKQNTSFNVPKANFSVGVANNEFGAGALETCYA